VTGDRRKQMMAGELLDDNEVIAILEKVLDSLPDDSEYLLDGFPRTVPQAEWLVERLKSKHSSITCVIYLDASLQTVKKRLQARGRTDDREEVIEERFGEYERLTQPLLEWYKNHGIQVMNVNAERSPNEVHADLTKLLET
ncbi:MAG TPA: nucleoside monophosphate kinase, partial [Patescibacteria group bacterium]|nr:nucleoside monophosphate kinase [Patescibacteria group bacterium]